MNTDDPNLVAVVARAVDECRKIGYNPTRFQVMLKQHGAVGALSRLLDSPEVSEGFKKLFEMGRLDLSAEAIALRPEFQRHFTSEQLDRARKRLAGAVYARAEP